MKKIFFCLILSQFVAFLLASCGREEYKTSFVGVLYADSTMSAVLPHDTLMLERESNDIKVQIVTDEEGRFGFSWWSNGVDSPESAGTKFQYDFPFFYISYHDTTLLCREECGDYKDLKLYPGMNVWEGGWK